MFANPCKRRLYPTKSTGGGVVLVVERLGRFIDRTEVTNIQQAQLTSQFRTGDWVGKMRPSITGVSLRSFRQGIFILP
jgi:hypothetical protein